MPASMMRLVAGGKASVAGSKIAIAPDVPIPGNTPTAVPTKAPSSAASTFAGVKAIEKP